MGVTRNVGYREYYRRLDKYQHYVWPGGYVEGIGRDIIDTGNILYSHYNN